MAFQLTPLHIPSLTTDYSAQTNATARLGQMLGDLPGDLRKQQLEQQKQQLLGSLTSGNPDYTKVGLGLVALGDTQGGASLLALGQKQLERDAYKSSPLSGGSAQPTLGSQPAAPLGAATIARPRGVQVAETEDDVQRLEAEMAGRSQAGNPAQPRGLRSNNPGNIESGRFAATVQGFQGSDGRFARYETPEQGIQAADKLLQSYAGRGLNTVNGIVNRWAPPTENNTGAYVASVAKELGVSPDQPLDMSNPEVRQRLIAAKIRVENGRQPYGEEVFQRAYAGNGAAPVQVAEAAPQPNTPMADAPAPGAGFVTGPATTQAAQAQGFAIPGTSLPPNDPRPGVSNQQLIEILGNPYLKDQHPIAKYILDARQKYTDENAPDKREQTRLTTEKLRREVEGEGATPLSAEERKSFGIPEGQAAYKTRSGEIKFGPAGTKVDINQKGESKFEEALGTAQAKRWNGYIEEGDVAQGRLADIQTLRETSRRLGSQGSSANLKSTIGPYAESLGIKVDGLSDIQLYESITNRLAPNLRAPGSGSTSDIEFKGFQRAIGPLSNTPAAREMILDTFEAASRNDIARSQIASRLASGEINRGEAEKQLRALPDPMTSFKEFRKQNPDLVGQALKESARVDFEQRNAPVKVDSPDAYSKLKPGDKYTDPEGNVRTKR